MYELLLRVKTRDAALLYCWMKKVAPAGRLSYTNLDALASWVNADGLRTSRESAFTTRVIRERLQELEGAGLIGRVYGENYFDVYIYNPEIADIDIEDIDHDENGNGNGNGNGNRYGNGIGTDQRARARNKEYIYKINKQINNQEGKTMRETTWKDLQEEPIQIDEATQNQRKPQGPTPEEALRKINFSDEKVARFRADIVKRIWEPDINPELIDRLVGAAVLKLANFNVKAAFNLCRAAQESRSLYDRTDGRAGKKHLWQTIGYSIKRIYEAAGYVWTPTRIGNEPAPEYRPIIPAEAMRSDRQRAEANTPIERPEEPKDYGDRQVEGFTVGDLHKSIDEFEREVRARFNTRPGIETRARALEIRNALRGLVALASELSTPKDTEGAGPRPRASRGAIGAL